VHGANEAEFALLVTDRCQKQGLGTELLKRLVQVGREEKLARIAADIMADNHAMQHICRKVGFKLEHSIAGHDFVAEYVL
jgi:acetyltransferase